MRLEAVIGISDECSSYLSWEDGWDTYGDRLGHEDQEFFLGRQLMQAVIVRLKIFARAVLIKFSQFCSYRNWWAE